MYLTKEEMVAVEHFVTAIRSRWTNEIVNIRLFGSKARGDAGLESDIDLIIVTRHDDWHLKEEIGWVATRVLLDEGIYLSIKVIGQQAYDKLHRIQAPFIRTIEREGSLV